MHTEAFEFVMETLVQLPRRTRVVEFGARDFNGSIRPLFAAADEYTSVDILPGPNVDVVIDAAEYTPPRAPDTVVCCEVLEHASNAPRIVENALRILEPGGVLLLTCATDPRAPHSGIDGAMVRPGEYYANVSPDDLVEWLAGADVRILNTWSWGDLQCLAIKP